MSISSEKALLEVLSSASRPVASCAKLDRFLRDLRESRNNLGLVFYPCFDAILGTLYGFFKDRRPPWILTVPQTQLLRVFSPFAPPPSSSSSSSSSSSRPRPGSFFDTLFTLCSYPPLQHRLPVARLPAPTRRLVALKQFEQLSPLFRGKERCMEEEGVVEMSVYEYFFFAFAYYRVGGASMPPMSKARKVNRESTYQTLLEDYLDHFVPIDGGRVPRADGQHTHTFLLSVAEWWMGQNTPDTSMYAVSYARPASDLVDSVDRLVMHVLCNRELDSGSTALANYVQLPLFRYFRAAFRRWPLAKMRAFPDKMVDTLITWLQPWMAPDFYEEVRFRPLKGRRRPARRVPHYSDEAWGGFLDENLCFYTALAVDFCAVAQNLDLKAGDDVALIRRVFRVFFNDKDPDRRLLAAVRRVEEEHLSGGAASQQYQHQHQHQHQHYFGAGAGDRTETVQSFVELLSGQPWQAYEGLLHPRSRQTAAELLQLLRVHRLSLEAELAPPAAKVAGGGNAAADTTADMDLSPRVLFDGDDDGAGAGWDAPATPAQLKRRAAAGGATAAAAAAKGPSPSGKRGKKRKQTASMAEMWVDLRLSVTETYREVSAAVRAAMPRRVPRPREACRRASSAMVSFLFATDDEDEGGGGGGGGKSKKKKKKGKGKDKGASSGGGYSVTVRQYDEVIDMLAQTFALEDELECEELAPLQQARNWLGSRRPTDDDVADDDVHAERLDEDADPRGRLTSRGREQIIRGQRVCDRGAVQFWGDVWDRPVTSRELAPLVWVARSVSEAATAAINGRCAVCGRAAIGDGGGGEGRCWDHDGALSPYPTRVNLRPLASVVNLAWLLFLVWAVWSVLF